MLFFIQITIASVAASAPLGNDKRFYSHDANLKSYWNDEHRIIAVQPMVICFFWEKQVSVAPKDVYRPSIFFSYLNTQKYGLFCSLRLVQLRKYSPNSRCHPPSCLLAVFAMFLTITSPCSSCTSYSWNEWSVGHFCFHNQNNSTSSPGLLG